MRSGARQIRFLHDLFDAETAERWGLVNTIVPLDGLELFVDTDEAREGAAAFAEKRKPDFGPYR